MTKKRKSLLSRLMTLVMAFTMVFAMTITAFADGETYTLTLNNTGKTAHTFEVYQIFTGDLHEGVLSNIVWGSNVSEAGQAALGDAKAYAETITTENVEAVAETLSGYLTGTPETVKVEAGQSGTVSGLKPGYYFVKDEDASQTGENSAYTRYILEVVEDVTAETKLDSPTVEKKVKDVNESTGVTSDWQDSADYKVGQDIPYQITGTLPSNYDKYTTYYYQFSDTMSAGLDYTAETATITVGSTDITSYFAENITTNADGSKTITWTCTNLKAIESLSSSSEIVVSYNAKLNDKAVMGEDGNPNTVKLIYSNNPNNAGDGKDTGETPEDKNIVFTYNVTFDKYSEEVAEENKLPGAGFTLYKKIGTEWVAVGEEIQGEALSTFTWNRVDDGDYKLVETTVPAGYNKMADLEFTISAEHDTESADPKLTSLSGNITTGAVEGQTFTVANDNSGLSADVINNRGSELPSTGGIGTTIFYVLGSLLVAGAAILMITRKRMSNNA